MVKFLASNLKTKGNQMSAVLPTGSIPSPAAPAPVSSGNSFLRFAQNDKLSLETRVQHFQSLLQSLEHQRLGEEDYRQIYQLLPNFLPHLLAQKEWVSILQLLLDHTPEFAESQKVLASQLARYFKPDAKTPVPDLSAYVNPFQYYTRALAIDPQSEELHQEVSSLFFRLIRKNFRKDLESFLANGLFDRFSDAINRIIPLQSFMTCQQDLTDLCEDAQAVIREASAAARPHCTPHLIVIQRYLDLALEPVSTLSRRYPSSLEKLRKSFSDPQKMFSQWKIFFNEVILKDCFTILGKPPCGYDIRVMGSMGKQEPCPYSDLEYFILIKEEKHRPYFVEMVKLLALQTILLRETAPNEIPIFTSLGSRHFSGFHIDTAENAEGMIKTPSQMAAFQGIIMEGDLFEANSFQMMSLRTSSFSTDGDPALFGAYVKAVSEILDQPPEENSLRKSQALKLLNIRVKSFYEGVWKTPFSPHFKDVNIKEHYTVFLHYVLSDLAIYYNIEKVRSLEIIDELVKKGVFTERSAQILRRSVLDVYAIRVDLHERYEHQSEEASFPGIRSSHLNLRSDQITSLEQAYWLVLFPFYDYLKKSSSSVALFEEKFKTIDLIDQSLQLAFETFKVSKNYKTVLKNLVGALCAIDASYEDHLKYYEQVGKIPSEHDELRALYLQVLRQKGSKFVDQLEDEPNPSGIRRSYLRMQQELIDAIAFISPEKTPQTDARGFAVKISTSDRSDQYLNAEVIEALIDDEGKIKKVFPGSAHHVCFLPSQGLFFKGMPTQPLTEYAIHSFVSRVVGNLTPSVELVRFEVTKGSETSVYPVLISKTIPGASLSDPSLEWEDCDHKQWTQMFLATILTRPGDGRPSNYSILGEGKKLKIYSVDNDISLVEPIVVKKVKDRPTHVIQFCSALFCLFPDAELDREVLEKFQQIDVSVILNSWLDEIIEKENRWIPCFSEPERENFFKSAESCRINNLIPEGTVAYLDIQLFRLQAFFKSLEGRPCTVNRLLEQLISLRLDKPEASPSGVYIARKYKETMKLPTFDERLGRITGRDVTQSMKPFESDLATLGEEVDWDNIKTYSLEQARSELYRAVMGQEASGVIFKKISAEDIVHGFFEQELSETRQTLILKAVAHYIQKEKMKPTAISLQFCLALNSDSLIPLLHDQLEYLDIRYCLNISDSDVQTIREKCPNLRELYLSGCGKLVFVAETRNTIFQRPPLVFPRLRVLEAEKCESMQWVNVIAPLLRRIVLNHNPSLEWVDAPTFSSKVQTRDCPKLKYKKTEIEDPEQWLRVASEGFRKNPEIRFAIDKLRILRDLKRTGSELQLLPKEMQQDREVVLKVVRRNGKALQFANDAFKDVKEIVLEAVKHTGMALKFASQRLADSEEIVREAVKQDGMALEFAHPRLKKDKDVVLQAVKQRGGALEHADSSLKDTEEVVLAALQQNGMALQSAGLTLRRQENVVLAAVSECGLALCYAAPELLDNEIVVRTAVQQNGLVLQYLSEKNKINESIVMFAVQQNGLALEYAGAFRINEKVVLAAVQQNGLAIDHATEFQANEKVVMAAVQQNGLALNYVKELQTKQIVVLAAVRQNGLALEFAPKFQDVEEVVLAAVNQNGLALKYVSNRLKIDRTVFLKAVQQNGLALRWGNSEQQNDLSFVLAAVNQNGAALEFASKTLKKDPKVVLAAIQQNGMALSYAHEKLQSNQKYVKAAWTNNPEALTCATEALRANKKFIVELLEAEIEKSLHEYKVHRHFMLKGSLRTFQHVHPDLRDNKDVVLRAVRFNPQALQYASEKMRSDLDVITEAVKRDWDLFQFTCIRLVKEGDVDWSTSSLPEASGILPEYEREFVVNNAFRFAGVKLRQNEGFVLSILKMQEGMAFSYVSKKLKSDREFLVKAVSTGYRVLSYVDEAFQNDKKIVLAAVQSSGIALRWASSRLKADKEVVLAAIKQRPCALYDADVVLRNSKEFILEAMKQDKTVLQYATKEVALEVVNQRGWALQYVSQALKDDKEFIKSAVCHIGGVLEYAPEKFRTDPDVVLAAVLQFGGALRYASDALQADPDIVIPAVKQYGGALQYVKGGLNGRRKVVMEAVKNMGAALEHAAPELQNEKDVVLEAVKKDPLSLRWAKYDMRDNEEIVSAAVNRDGRALEFASSGLKASHRIVRRAVEQYGMALQFADATLQNNVSIVTAAYLQNSKSLKFASPDIQKGWDLLAPAEPLDKIMERMREEGRFPFSPKS